MVSAAQEENFCASVHCDGLINESKIAVSSFGKEHTIADPFKALHAKLRVSVVYKRKGIDQCAARPCYGEKRRIIRLVFISKTIFGGAEEIRSVNQWRNTFVLRFSEAWYWVSVKRSGQVTGHAGVALTGSVNMVNV